MARLSTAQRKRLPRSAFALPQRGEGEAERGGFPIPDRSHAIQAKARATQGVKKGYLTSAQAATIRRRVHAKYPDL